MDADDVEKGMADFRPTHCILRQLTGSELGWFAEPRRMGKARGRQRGINFNARDMESIFPAGAIESGDIPITSRRLSDAQVQERRIRRQEKNWRLVGEKVSGKGLEFLEEGDIFWAFIEVADRPPYRMVWDVVAAAANPDLHARLLREFAAFLRDKMASWPTSDPIAAYFAVATGLQKEPAAGRKAPTEAAPAGPIKSRAAPKMPSKPLPAESEPRKKRKRIEDRLHRPHILAELMKSGMALSSRAQADFIDVLDTLSSELRKLLLEAGLIRKVEINHRKAWAGVRGTKIGFVDGGMANIAAMGAAPVAIRVGSYVVIPGERGPDREAFNFEIQLVDDLYEASATHGGIYEDVFEDVAKLRDVARIACEVGGVLSLTMRENPPDVVCLHGPLVNPVSPYALGTPGQPGAFPNFTKETIQKLLPGDSKSRTGPEANFVAVYLEQLNRLKSGRATVCGVVERPSTTSPGPLIRSLVERMHSEGRIDAPARKEFLDKMEGYRITDSVIFECVLDEGEYIEPVEIDKQGPDHKIPAAWAPEIKSYPKPSTTYVKANAETMPVRVESFPTGRLSHPQLMSLEVHMSRLLPRYSFPVGLDIVDKHAKVPEWMSKQVSTMLTAQLMRKAMETGNPAAVRMVRRILSANTRDWLFRPDFRGD